MLPRDYDVLRMLIRDLMHACISASFFSHKGGSVGPKGGLVVAFSGNGVAARCLPLFSSSSHQYTSRISHEASVHDLLLTVEKEREIMDPFDDFDPQNFDYDDSDQEDDIVYLEGPVQGEDPFLPYLAKDVELSQSQMSQQQQQHQQQVPNLLPRRERQRRRAEQILMEEESSDSELSHQDNATGEENAFASLQSLLEKQSQQAKENAAANQDESVAAVDVREGTALGRDPPSIAQEEPEHAVPVQDANENLIPETQSQQFPLAEDWDLTQENPTQARSVPMVSNSAAEYASMSLDAPSISAGLVKELRRVQKQKHIVSEPSAMVNLSKAVDSNLLSELHKNRKRLAQEKATSGPRKRSGGSIKSNPPQFHRNRTRKTHVTKDTKSIVGSR